MKHIKLFEDFDLDKFLENPDKELSNDDYPEINIGSWTIVLQQLNYIIQKETG